MKCEFMVGDFAMTRDVEGLTKRYRGLTCRVVEVDDDWQVRIVFDEDPNGKPGRTYIANTEDLTHLCGDEPDCETISEFLNDM